MKKEKKQEINLKSLLTNRRYLVISVFSGIIGLMIVFMGIIPQINQNFDMNREIKTEQEKLKSLIQKVSDLENVSAQEAFSSVGLVNQILPSKKPLLELLAALNASAAKDGVVFTNLSLSPGEIASESAQFLDRAKTTSKRKKKTAPVSKEGYSSLDVELEVSGIFSDIQEFLLNIEKVAPLINIKSLSLNIKSENIIRPTDQVEAELVVSVYYFTQTVSAALESSLPDIGRREQEIISEVNGYFYPSVNVQEQIVGGGLEDLFGLSSEEIEESELLQINQ